MSVAKFRFVSPGVQINEIDNSQLPRTPEAMGPVVIGRSLRGPMMRPVKVQSFADFVELFGEPVAGGKGGDVWRDGNRLAPTYGVYAAQAYLRNSNPLTFVRLGGFQNENAGNTTDAKAGWKLGTETAYGLFLAPLTGSNQVYNVSGSAPLAAIIYSKDNSIGLSGYPLSGSTRSVSNQKATWVRTDGAGFEVQMVLNGKSFNVNLNESSKKYIRNALNVNPTLTNSTVVSSAENYFLGETFPTWVAAKGHSSTAADQYAAILLPLVSSSLDFGNFKKGAEAASTGWIVSQHKGVTGSFEASGASNAYPVTNLFKLVGLSEGEWNSQNLKISIEDIKEPANEFIKYGTFTVSIRKIDDNDLNPVYLERFNGLTLDPSSENFIARRIGDKYTEWSYTDKKYLEYGTYDNKSKFVRVQLNPDVENGLSDADLLPFGFYGPQILDDKLVTGTSSGSISAAGSFIGTQITGSATSTYSASFSLPELPLVISGSDLSFIPSPSSLYWGLKTNYGTVRKHNKDIVDVVRARPYNYDAAKYSFLFSLDDVSGSVVSGSVLDLSTCAWREGFRKDGLSLTAQTNTTGSITNSSLVLSTFNKFTVPLVGGFDGLNIVEKDPFNRRVLAVGGTDISNYAYNSIKVAIESISDPEVVEMNLAAIPGVDNQSLTALLLDKCEQRGDALAVLDLNGDYIPEEGKASHTTTAAQRKPNVNTTVSNLKDRAINSSYGCSFFPWVLVRDNLNSSTVWVPPSVAALGTFSSAQANTELWFAPAGFNRGGLTNGAAGLPVLQTALRLTSKDRDTLYEANINPIASFPAEGIVIFGQKTLQVTPSALDRINVRRLMIYLKKEISRFASTILFDPNAAVTWKRFTNLVVPFLDGVKSRFGLSDFRVVLDETTTTPDLVDRNVVYAKILLKPTRAIEFIALDFVILPTGASFAD